MKSNGMKRWVAITAGLLLLLSVGFGLCACTTGAKERNDTTAGSQTTQIDENTQNTEDSANSDYVYTNPDRIGYHYRMATEYDTDPNTNKAVFRQSVVERYNGENLLWRTPVTGFRLKECIAVSDGVVVYGHAGEKHEDTWVAKFSDTGQVLWQQKLDNGMGNFESVKGVVENAEGSYSVFTTCGYFCMHKFSADGQHILFQKNEVEDKTFGCVTRVGDGYWAQLGHMESHIVQMDNTGKITGALDLKKENFNYTIHDMIEYNGKVYISADVTPKLVERDLDNRNRLEILDLIAMCADKSTLTWELVNGENRADITQRYKNHYTAVLLECDADTGAFQEVHTVKESKGRKLSINAAGALVWEVKEIIQVSYTPQYGSRLGRMSWRLQRCYFGDTGKLTQQEKTNIKYSDDI